VLAIWSDILKMTFVLNLTLTDLVCDTVYVQFNNVFFYIL